MSQTPTQSTLNHRITMRPHFSLLTVQLDPGQKVYAEPSAMVSMDATIDLKAGLKGGFSKTIGRMLGGESIIINTFTAARGAGEVTFAPGTPGDILHYHLQGRSLMLQRGAFLAYSDGVELTGKWQGAKGFFSGEGLILLKATGEGDIFFNSYGAILPIDVTGEFIVDTGYIVAFEDTLNYKVSVLPGLRSGGTIKSFFFGGEGLVCRFSGHGKVWVQTRCVYPFLTWIYPFRPSKSK
ncbi:MAG: TIGR00266 family protein [Gemmatales bacterium]|nr:MAG: TIGR00266 family protein [Gemmatales bacterium]